ncbi:MAG: polysaccharide deacetylase family protein [Calditrichaeota bacterium]|nr:polysaccharide deacetylase family protein [Calditrichota bacterium]
MTLSQIGPMLARGWQTHCWSPGHVALTFDDGPDPQTTPKLLETLDKLSLKATMFVIGQKCRGNAALLKEMSAAGHAIACHGYAHEKHWFKSSSFVQASIRQTMFMLQEFGIKMAPMFRPPFGAIDLTMHRRVSELKITPVLWSAHISDWKPQTADAVRQKLVSSVHDRMILLLHDGHETTTNVIEQLPYLRDELVKRNLSSVALSDKPKSILTA